MLLLHLNRESWKKYIHVEHVWEGCCDALENMASPAVEKVRLPPMFPEMCPAFGGVDFGEYNKEIFYGGIK